MTAVVQFALPAMSVVVPAHGRPYSLSLTLPPLAAIFLKPEPA